MDNEFIAEFMGAKSMMLGNENGTYTKGWLFPTKPSPEYDLEYDSNWSWLMPVVEKITPIARQVGSDYTWSEMKSYMKVVKVKCTVL